MATDEKYDFAYRGIVDDEYAFLPDFLDSSENNVNQLLVKFSYSDSILTCTVSWRLSSAGKSPFIVATLLTEFAVSEAVFKAGLSEDENELKFEKSNLIQIADITVGALRGFVYAKLKNSSIQVAVPLLSMTEVMKDHDPTFYVNSSEEEVA